MSETLNAQDIAKKLQEQLTSLSATVDTHEVSTVDEVGDGIARVTASRAPWQASFWSSRAPIPVRPSSALPRTLTVTRSAPFCFGAVDSIKEGDECRTTGRIMDIPVSRAMLGRVSIRSASLSTVG